MSDTVTRTYERFPLARRIEHLVMLLSFTTLALTGLPQKFASADLSIAFVYILGGIENLRRIHHSAAIVMMLGTAWHILVFGYMGYVRRTRLTMLPSLQDVKDGWQALLYNIGLAKTPPQMGRYTFEEKMEYWAFVWGAIIMGLTGFMMWNPITITRLLPGEAIPAAKAAHGAEAILAALAIFMLFGVYGFVRVEQTALTTTERRVPTVVVFVPQTPTPAPTVTPTLPATETLVPTPTSANATPSTPG